MPILYLKSYNFLFSRSTYILILVAFFSFYDYPIPLHYILTVCHTVDTGDDPYGTLNPLGVKHLEENTLRLSIKPTCHLSD
jgi:hypothetical protein